MDAQKARELIEVYGAIKGAYPRGNDLDVSKLTAEVVFNSGPGSALT
jgi:hypothetical protein